MNWLRILFWVFFLAVAGDTQAQTGGGAKVPTGGNVAKPTDGAARVLNTKWRTYYLPITDTVMIQFRKDTMAVTTSTGAALLRSTFKLEKDVITFHDFAGENMCADLAGAYQVRIADDTMILVMDRDPCDARVGTLMAKRWVRVKEVMAPPAAAPKRKKQG
jgi:hypothetical protein